MIIDMLDMSNPVFYAALGFFLTLLGIIVLYFGYIISSMKMEVSNKIVNYGRGFLFVFLFIVAPVVLIFDFKNFSSVFDFKTLLLILQFSILLILYFKYQYSTYLKYENKLKIEKRQTFFKKNMFLKKIKGIFNDVEINFYNGFLYSFLQIISFFFIVKVHSYLLIFISILILLINYNIMALLYGFNNKNYYNVKIFVEGMDVSVSGKKVNESEEFYTIYNVKNEKIQMINKNKIIRIEK